MNTLLAWLLSSAGKALGGLLVIGATGYAIYAYGYSCGRSDVLAELAGERVKILIDGKAIDNAVLAADDDALCGLLGGCL